MKSNPVYFIAFQEHDNLGIGYMTSVLIQNGYKVKIIDFQIPEEDILRNIKSDDPLIIGFSIIFQYHISRFKELISFLRENKVDCHFCAGGHYPSLKYKNLFDFIPTLDSIVLFEGEYTFLELVNSISNGKNWKNIQGIAYQENGHILVNSLKPLIENIDLFPIPARKPLKEYALGKKYVTLLAGRGCSYNCSFCSIHEFYSKPPGLIKRVRDPQFVVEEMELIYTHLDASIFIFQDDDFPVAGIKGREWIKRFCEELVRKDLHEKILWKISCRCDEVDYETFKLMKKSGFFLVYLGIESGNDHGLKIMNKHFTTRTNLDAVKILKDLDIEFDYGFMLFDPSSTYNSILENLWFLEDICSDGYSPISFCKLLPYAETKIERMLLNENRLKHTMGYEDYDFLDSSLNQCYYFIQECFGDWITQNDGLLNTQRWARYYLSVYRKFYSWTTEINELHMKIRSLIADSNRYLVGLLKEIVIHFKLGSIHFSEFPDWKNEINEKHKEYKLLVDNMIKVIQELTQQNKTNEVPL